MKVNVIGSYFRDSIHILNKNKYTHWESSGGISNVQIPDASYWSTGFNTSIQVINSFGTDGAVNHNEPYNNLNEIKRCLAQQDIPDWNHFAYLNTIRDLDVFDFKSKYTSCDISVSSNPKVSPESVINNIELSDFLFLSEETEHPDFLRAANVVIIHTSIGSKMIHNGKILASHQHQKENFIFTMGAGDKFAGYFIEGFLTPIASYDKLLEYAHQKTLTWLRKINEKL